MRRDRVRRSLAALSSIAALALVLTSCASGTPGGSGDASGTVLGSVPVSATATGVPSFYTPPNPLPAASPGALIREERVVGVPGVPAGATVWRVLYHSRSIYGSDIAESGYVIVPAGRAPKGGFPVLSWAHGTTGYSRVCAPSLFNDFDGGIGPYLAPDLRAFLSAGFEIAATDYEGLGTPRPDPYLVGDSEGQSVLDAARAAENLPGSNAGRTVVIYGHSQGGQAALFAGELAPRYAPELHVIGVVAAAPATNLSLIVENATSGLGQDILIFTVPAVLGWAETYRDLPISDLFTPSGTTLAKSVVETGCLGQVNAALSADHVTPAGVFAPNISSNPVVIAHAKLNDPGRHRTVAPILVVQGTADTTVPPYLTDSYVDNMACPIRDEIEYLHVFGATHGTIVTRAAPVILDWIMARLAGASPPSTCGKPGDLSTYSP